MHTITCPCGKTAETNARGNIGEVFKQTGFYPVISITGQFIWLCKSCTRKAAKLANELTEVLKDEYCIVPALRGPQLDKYLNDEIHTEKRVVGGEDIMMKKQIFRLNTFLTRTVGGFNQVVASATRDVWKHKKFPIIVIRERLSDGRVVIELSINGNLSGTYDISAGELKREQIEIFKNRVNYEVLNYGSSK